MQLADPRAASSATHYSGRRLYLSTKQPILRIPCHLVVVLDLQTRERTSLLSHLRHPAADSPRQATARPANGKAYTLTILRRPLSHHVLLYEMLAHVPTSTGLPLRNKPPVTAKSASLRQRWRRILPDTNRTWTTSMCTACTSISIATRSEPAATR